DGGGGGRGGSARRAAVLLAGAALTLLVLAQVALPHLAASRIRSKLGRYGSVTSAGVSAWPAVKLLWGEADAAHVQVARIALTPARAAALLWEGRGVKDLDVSAASIELGRLQLRDAILRKRGSLLSAEAHASGAAVRAALPAGVAVSLLRSGGGEVEVRVSGGLFGLGASVGAIAGPEQGRLVARPTGALLGGVRLTLFSDPHIDVSAVAAQPDGAGGYRLRIDALLR
ncbi:MAG: hypothetical protein ACYDC2_00305, partial [Solirubrobacteraceae bacterium]